VFSSTARAGVAECGGIRLEDAVTCEIRGELECTGGCEHLGVYEKACATKLHKVCRDTCTLDPEPTCTDSCTESCTRDCDAGVNVICIHNCFGECSGACLVSCEGAADHAQCQASCEATCDGECDIKCAPVVDGSCYTHCIECCGGSCTAQANMDCQTTCQDQEFRDCEYELEAECSGSCSGEGALFCDGKYVLSGSEIPGCVSALLAKGISTDDLRVDLDTDVVHDVREGFCSVDGSAAPRKSMLAMVAMMLVAGSFRRVRRSS